ncbi:MAG: PAS domain S-box protein [Betaproteobacteria bacterium]|nr:PAS domain S-box protein [Betaproteobacteria bacterium]
MLGISWIATLVIAAAYVAAAEGAMLLLRVAADAPMVSAASAVGLAACLHSGIRAAAGVWLGALGYELLGGRELVPAFGSSIVTTAQIALAWWLLQRVLRVSPKLERLRDVLMLILIGATVIPLANVARAALTGEWSPEIDPAVRVALLQVSALGEAIGIVLLVPAVLTWMAAQSRPQAGSIAERAIVYAGTLVVSVLVFSGRLAPAMSAETLPYALFPFTFWAALRLGLRDTSTVLLICGGIAIWFHAMGMGPFIMPSIAPEQTFAQFGSLYLFLGVLCVTSLLAAAAQGEREGAQTQVRESEQRYRMLIEGMNEGVNITDAAARMAFVSDRFCEMTGYARAELIGRTGEVLAVPEMQESWRESHRSRESGRAEPHALVLKRRDGQLLHVWISPKPQFDHAGHYIGSLNVVLDVTDRRRAEDKARSHLEQLAHVARVASMGEMASAIAHEINQPLTAIANYANASLRLLRAGNLSAEETADTMQRLATEAERAGAVVRKMRGFVRSEEGHLQAIGVDELFADVLRLTRGEAAQYEADVSAAGAGELPKVLADAIQIEQVLLNLVRNALEAIDAAGANERRVVLSAGRASDDMIEIQVSDTGPGLSAAAAEKVFEPFYTTKNEGIGIGLALSRSIVDAHGGRLWADASQPGAVFRLTLPIA